MGADSGPGLAIDRGAGGRRPVTRDYRMSWGAQLSRDGVRFRLWAPSAARVAVVIYGSRERTIPMEPLAGGWFEVTAGDCGAGTRYLYEIDGALRVPDPAARCAPDGPAE